MYKARIVKLLVAEGVWIVADDGMVHRDTILEKEVAATAASYYKPLKPVFHFPRW